MNRNLRKRLAFGVPGNPRLMSARVLLRYADVELDSE